MSSRLGTWRATLPSSNRLTEFKRAALLLDERIAEGIPDIRERLRTVTREHGLEFELVLVGDDVQASILGFPRNDHRSRRRRFPGGSRAEPTRPRRKRAELADLVGFPIEEQNFLIGADRAGVAAGGPRRHGG